MSKKHKQLVSWVWHKRRKEWNLMVQGRRYGAATVWTNGVWHTWDRSGVGGENSSESTVEKAKIEAAASAIQQGFV